MTYTDCKLCPDFPACGCGKTCERFRHKPPTDKIQALAQKLIGTSGHALVDEISDLDRWELRQLDVIAFACTKCDYWHAARDRVEVGVGQEWFCKECAREHGKS